MKDGDVFEIDGQAFRAVVRASVNSCHGCVGAVDDDLCGKMPDCSGGVDPEGTRFVYRRAAV